MPPSIGVVSDLHIADAMHNVTVEDGHRLADDVLNSDVDIIINLGDDTGSGLAREWLEVMPVTYRFVYSDKTYCIAPSNHDVTVGGVGREQITRPIWQLYAAGAMRGYTPWSDWPQVRDVDGLRIIIVDTCAENANLARGRIGDEQLERIGAAIEEWDGPVALFGHHCVTSRGSRLDVTRVLTDRQALREVVQGAGGADLFCAGHNHRKGEWSGVYGFQHLLALPMSARDGEWLRLEWSESAGRFEWEWMAVGHK